MPLVPSRIVAGISFLIALVMAPSGASQSPGGVHPHVAPLPAGVPTPVPAASPYHGRTPECNLANGVFDLGESGLGVDTGGFRSLDTAAPVLATPGAINPHVHKFLDPTTGAPEGWVSVTGMTVDPNGTTVSHSFWRFRGYFRDAPLAANVPIDDGAFEVTASQTFDPSDPTIVIITTPQTTSIKLASDGIAPDVGRFAGLGWRSLAGLENEPPYRPGVPPPVTPYISVCNWPLIVLNEQSLVPQRFNIVAAKSHARVTYVPLWSDMQRNLMLVQTVQQMLQTTDGTWRPPDGSGWPRFTGEVPVLAEGGSYGGYASMWMTLLFPDHFHGAFSGGAPASIRSYVGEQESWRHLMALTMAPGSGKAFDPYACTQYARALWGFKDAVLPSFPASNWSPFFHTSITAAFRDGTLQRPVYFVMSDEDAVATGSHQLAWFDLVQGYHDHGTSVINNGPKACWAVADRRCHPSGFHRTALTSTPTQTLVLDYLEFLPEVVASFAAAPGGTYVPQASADTTEDVYDHVFDAPPFTPIAPPGTTTPLRLDLTFGQNAFQNVIPAAAQRPGKSFGSGMYLGWRDSMIVRNQSVYVGSSEGVVTRFTVDASQEMVPQAMSVGLGYGAWGLAIGDLDGVAGDELAVATHRGLHVLNATTLALLTPVPATMSWESMRPHHVKVADVDPSPGQEILLTTELGELAVYRWNGASIAKLASYGEPGIADFEVLGTTAGVTEIVLLSERGLVAKIGWNIAAGTPPVLLATSPRINGKPEDLEVGPFNGTTCVITMHSRTVTFDTFHVFSIADLSSVPITSSGFGNNIARATNPAYFGDEWDFEIVPAAAGSTQLVVLGLGRVYLVDPTSMTIVGQKVLPSFAPMAWALDVAVGDIAETSGTELVVATKPGYVAWVPISALSEANAGANPSTTPPALPFGDYWNFTPNAVRNASTANGRPWFCNRTTAGTWGMTLDHTGQYLELLDQSGSRWRLDANGDLTLRYELRIVQSTVSAPNPGTFRGMVSLGANGAPTSVDPSLGNLVTTTTPNPILVPQVGQFVDCVTRPFVPAPGQDYPQVGVGNWTNQEPSALRVYDGYAVFPKGGAATVLSDPSSANAVQQVHWWSGEERDGVWPNLVQGLFLSGGANVSAVDWWATTAGPLAAGPSWSSAVHPHTAIQANDIRDGMMYPLAQADAQAIRLFEDPGTGEARIVVATAGGSAIVLDPTTLNTVSPVFAESDDFGTGGMALATSPSTVANANVDVYLGVLSYHGGYVGHQNHLGPDDQVGAVVWLWWDGTDLVKENVKLLDGSGANNPKAYGVCGIAVGDVIEGNAGAEIVVTTLDGWLLVFAKDVDGYLGSLLYKERVEGSLGAYNAIVIADLDPVAAGNEIYVAGSLGVRKWIRPAAG